VLDGQDDQDDQYYLDKINMSADGLGLGIGDEAGLIADDYGDLFSAEHRARILEHNALYFRTY
jgi:hypothetical protein